jgi:hypothetical protein
MAVPMNSFVWFWRDFDETAGSARFVFGDLELHMFEVDGSIVVLWTMGMRCWPAELALA